MRTAFFAAVCASALAAPAFAQTQPTATARIIDSRGQQVGSARLLQTPQGVLVDVGVGELPAGEHGFHFHETGSCDPATGFESAGSHYAPRGHQHGYVEGGAHAGDMPNQFVQQDGNLRAHVLNPHVTLEGGDAPLLDANGSALIVHSGADDYRSQPSGQAGGRLVCGVVERE